MLNTPMQTHLGNSFVHMLGYFSLQQHNASRCNELYVESDVEKGATLPILCIYYCACTYPCIHLPAWRLQLLPTHLY